MSKEKSAYPNVYNTEDSNGITYRQYLAARVYPEMINYGLKQDITWEETFQKAAELTWQAVDALIEAEVKE